jgi:hypothetical protein
VSDFQPPDPPEPDYDALWESWFDQQEKNGYAVLSRDEWKSRLNEAATDAYAEGRKDQREDDAELLAFVESWLADFTACGTTDSPREAEARALIAKATGEQA